MPYAINLENIYEHFFLSALMSTFTCQNIKTYGKEKKKIAQAFQICLSTNEKTTEVFAY